jgi:hypothetical protein
MGGMTACTLINRHYWWLGLHTHCECLRGWQPTLKTVHGDGDSRAHEFQMHANANARGRRASSAALSGPPECSNATVDSAVNSPTTMTTTTLMTAGDKAVKTSTTTTTTTTTVTTTTTTAATQSGNGNDGAANPSDVRIVVLSRATSEENDALIKPSESSEAGVKLSKKGIETQFRRAISRGDSDSGELSRQSVRIATSCFFLFWSFVCCCC